VAGRSPSSAGSRPPAEREPEDWVASTTTLAGEELLGLSVLPDGRSLKAAIEEEPGSLAGSCAIWTASGPTPVCSSSCWMPASGYPSMLIRMGRSRLGTWAEHMAKRRRGSSWTAVRSTWASNKM
jgi:hypothetical protein